MLSDQRQLKPAQERYVECIWDAEQHHGHAHVSLLAEELGVAKPSVVQMVARLVGLGIVRRNDKEIGLTPEGRRIAAELHGRHSVLEDFMVEKLGMDARAASREACRLEHVVSGRFMRGLRSHMGRDE